MLSDEVGKGVSSPGISKFGLGPTSRLGFGWPWMQPGHQDF